MLKARFALICAVCITILAFGMVGCSDSPSQLMVTQTALNPVTVYGKVIDKQTQTGIAGATVYLKVGGSWMATTTMGSTGTSGAENQIGNFTFASLPASASLPMVIKGPATGSYLQLQTFVFTNDYTGNGGGVNSKIDQDLGKYSLEQGVTATVYLVDTNTGQYVAKDDDSAIAIYMGMGAGSVADVLATQDTTDTNKYTITVPQSSATTLTVPATDLDADGKYDYQSGTVRVGLEYLPGFGGDDDGICETGEACIGPASDVTTLVKLSPITSTTTLGVLDNNLMTGGTNGSGTTMNFLGASDSLMIFFNLPVELVSTSSPRMTYIDDLKTMLTTTDVVLTEVNVSATMGADGTVLTLDPATALTEKENYTIVENSITLKSKVTDADDIVQADDTVYSLSAVDAGSTSFFVSATGTGTVGSTPVVTVDNANYWNDGGVITTADAIAEAPGSPLLVFPEPVWGKVSLISYTDGPTSTATTTPVYSTPANLTGQGYAQWAMVDSSDTLNNGSALALEVIGDFVGNEDGTCDVLETCANEPDSGLNREGTLYTFNLDTAFGASLGTMNDNTSANTSNVTLEINAYDAEGNAYQVVQSFDIE